MLDEGEAVELLAYLVTAARTQLDEAAEYAPMRLLTAAARLAGYAELYRAVARNDRMCLCGMLAAEYSTLPAAMRMSSMTLPVPSALATKQTFEIACALRGPIFRKYERHSCHLRGR